MQKFLRLAVGILLLQPWNLSAQVGGDITVVPGVKYEIGGIRISGSDNLDKQVITLISGLQVGQEITLPGEETTKAIENLWRQKLFDDIGVYVTEVKGKLVFLEIRLRELPKLSKYGIKGLSKAKRDNLRDELDLNSGLIVTENLIVNTRNVARDFFVNDGYLNAKVEVRKKPDTTRSNSVILDILVERGERVKIKDINIVGNTMISDKKVRKAMDETVRSRPWNIFKSSKLIKADFDEDKRLIIEKYNAEGFRDARIVKDSVYAVDDDRINIDLHVVEGPKYYFGNITWLGNSKYTDEVLAEVLGIKKGDVYDATFLNERMFVDLTGRHRSRNA